MKKLDKNYLVLIKQLFMKHIRVVMGFLLIAFYGCTSGGNESDSAGTVKIDGSSTVYPITEAVAEEFRGGHPDVNVTVGLSGTGGGFKKFIRGEIDINNASRTISPEEMEGAKAENIDYVGLMIAYDGMAIIVNPANTWCKDITIAELKKIWEPAAQEKIMYWNQIRPEWPKEELHLFGPGVESGTYDYFTEVIVGTSHSSRGDFTASEDDNVLVQGVSSDKFALGFFGLAYFNENKAKLKLVAVDNQKGAGPILPSIQTVKDKSYSPLGRPIYIYVTNAATKRKEVQEFVSFYLDNMGALSQEIGYVSLPAEEIATEKAKWTAFIAKNAPK